MQLLRDANRVAAGVEERVRVAEGDVLGTGTDLLLDVGEHVVALHDPDPAAVDRRDRAVPTQMPTTAGGLGVADHPPFRAERQLGVVGQRRQAAAVGHREGQPVQRGQCTRGGARRADGLAHPVDQLGLVLAADHRVGAQRDQVLTVGPCPAPRRVEADPGIRVDGPHCRAGVDRQAGRSVHRDVEGDHRGLRHQFGVQRRAGQVQVVHLVSGRGQPGGGGRQPERLMPQVVGTDQENSTRSCPRTRRVGCSKGSHGCRGPPSVRDHDGVLADGRVDDDGPVPLVVE